MTESLPYDGRDAYKTGKARETATSQLTQQLILESCHFGLGRSGGLLPSQAL